MRNIQMHIGYDASPVRRYMSGVGYYAASVLQALSAQYPDREFLLLSHLGGSVLKGANLIPTQRRAFPIKEIWMQVWLPHLLARWRPDLCHFTNSIAPLRLQIPYVITVHDLSLIQHPEWHPWTRRAWMRRIMRRSVSGARLVLCDSEATRQDLATWMPLKESDVRVVPLGARALFRQTCSRETRETVLARYNLYRPFFLYLGNLEPRKNLSLLLEAFWKLDTSEVDLVLAGRRAWLWKGVVRELTRPRGKGKVHLLDYVPERDLPVLYQSALAFVYPSLMEGFGLPVLEAMASGTPVVVSRVEPLVSLVRDAGWLADPKDVEEWSATLGQVLRDEKERIALALRAKARSAEYTWERAARATMRCYEEALSRPVYAGRVTNRMQPGGHVGSNARGNLSS